LKRCDCGRWATKSVGTFVCDCGTFKPKPAST
jgi:hypothetical protein